MKFPSPLKLALAGILLTGGFVSDVTADVIYRETFGASNPPTTDLATTVFDWQQFGSTGTALTAARINRTNDGRLTNVANVNAGPNSDGTTGAYAKGLQFVMSAPSNLAITTEYSFDIADYQPGSLTFSWYAGNADATSTQQLVVRIGSNWYANITTKSTAATTLANFATQAQFQSISFDPTASQWKLINFNGNYTVGVTPGTGTATNSSLGSITTLGAAPGSDLTGMITGFGLYSIANSNNVRFDTFEISGITAVPEPALAQLFLVGGIGFFLIQRRRRRRIS